MGIVFNIFLLYFSMQVVMFEWFQLQELITVEVS